jgi:1-deoxy-D-xylulose-5-phosphate reductoisomerase
METNRRSWKASEERGAPHGVVILGATGSIGRTALDVVERFPDHLRLIGISAHRKTEGLPALVRRYHPRVLALPDPDGLSAIRADLPAGLDLELGPNSLDMLAAREDVSIVLVAVSGYAGLSPTLASLRRGKRVALATKEALVAAGDLVQDAASQGGGEIIPVDSEHSAIYQCLEGRDRKDLQRIILTASGGSFRGWERDRLAQVTVQEALAHPTWRMGPKVTIDSATLVNKGLEIIEAHHLFGLPGERIEVLLHPQSIVHSLVELVDGAVFAQLSLPDMRLPIQYALTVPDRLPSSLQPLDLAAVGNLGFSRPDDNLFPALSLAYAALKEGGTAPAVFSAADEMAVELFLNQRIPFLQILELVREAVETHQARPATLESVREADLWARAWVREKVKNHSR